MLTANATGEGDVLAHDSDTAGVGCAQVGVLEETDEVGLRSLLQSEDSGTLETHLTKRTLLGELTNETLERQLADEKLSGLLVTANLTDSHGTGAVTVGLLHTGSSGGRLAGSLMGEGLAGGLTTGLAGGLLSTSYFKKGKSSWPPVN